MIFPRPDLGQCPYRVPEIFIAWLIVVFEESRTHGPRTGIKSCQVRMTVHVIPWVQGWGARFGVPGSGFRVRGSEFRVQSSGFGVQSSGYKRKFA